VNNCADTKSFYAQAVAPKLKPTLASDPHWLSTMRSDELVHPTARLQEGRGQLTVHFKHTRPAVVTAVLCTDDFQQFCDLGIHDFFLDN
jgi:hypothetical protein